jgi:Spy/CpxP family protein refolding chaperone
MFGFGACASKRGGGGSGFGPSGFGAPWAHKMHGGGCGGPMAMLRDLNLTDQQLEKVAELKLEGLAACAQFKLSLGQAARQIVDELTKEQIDKAKVKEFAKDLKERKSQMGDAMLDRIITFAGLDEASEE